MKEDEREEEGRWKNRQKSKMKEEQEERAIKSKEGSTVKMNNNHRELQVKTNLKTKRVLQDQLKEKSKNHTTIQNGNRWDSNIVGLTVKTSSMMLDCEKQNAPGGDWTHDRRVPHTTVTFGITNSS